MKDYIVLAIEQNIDLIDTNPIQFLRKYRDSRDICTELANTLLDADIEIIDPSTQTNILVKDAIYLFTPNDQSNWIDNFNGNYTIGTDPQTTCKVINKALNSLRASCIQAPNLNRRSSYGDLIEDLYADQLWIEIDAFLPDNQLDISIVVDAHDVPYQYWKLRVDIGSNVARVYPMLDVTVVNGSALVVELDMILNKIVREL